MTETLIIFGFIAISSIAAIYLFNKANKAYSEIIKEIEEKDSNRTIRESENDE